MILVNEPIIEQDEISNVMRCLNTGWISSAGSFIEEFENRWAGFCGMKYGVAVCNGTAALEIAVRCLDLEPGSEVILPSFTIISCIQAIINCRLKPVLVDCEPDTWCMDVGQVEEKITSRTKAIMPVHMYGHPVDMDPLLNLARRHGLYIIEDAAEVHGGEYKGRKCGGMGDISCFSFFANKIITTGEGGMLLTNNSVFAHRARQIRNLCFEPGRRFVHRTLGYNFRMTNIQAAIGLAQVSRINQLVVKKISVGSYYLSQLRSVAGIQLPVQRSWAKNVYWMFGFILQEETGETGETFAAKMREIGVETRPFFLGMHQQPVFVEQGLFDGEEYPVTDRISRMGIYIPTGLNLTEKIQDEVVEAVKSVLSH